MKLVDPWNLPMERGEERMLKAAARQISLRSVKGKLFDGRTRAGDSFDRKKKSVGYKQLKTK